MLDVKDIEVLLIICWIVLGIVVLIDGPSKLVFGAIWITYLASAVKNLVLEFWDDEDNNSDMSVVGGIYRWFRSRQHDR